jgi:hypothetical protein
MKTTRNCSAFCLSAESSRMVNGCRPRPTSSRARSARCCICLVSAPALAMLRARLRRTLFVRERAGSGPFTGISRRWLGARISNRNHATNRFQRSEASRNESVPCRRIQDRFPRFRNASSFWDRRAMQGARQSSCGSDFSFRFTRSATASAASSKQFKRNLRKRPICLSLLRYVIHL